tara:strand:+ start:295 stop:495 length:201 start_codon:yes stop_codon:yes gene_type:complete
VQTQHRACAAVMIVRAQTAHVTQTSAHVDLVAHALVLPVVRLSAVTKAAVMTLLSNQVAARIVNVL